MDNTSAEQQFIDELGIPTEPTENPLEATLEVKPEEEESKEPKESKETKGSDESAELKAKNRRERRLLEKLQQEREANIEINARLQTLSESQQARQSEESDYLKLVDRLYGTNTPEGKEATELLKDILRGVHKDARDEALKEAMSQFQQEKENEARAVQEEEQKLEDMMESIEDEYDADFSNASERKGFLNLLEKFSPKDSDGNIREYADPFMVYEYFQSQKSKTPNKAKQLASRSMTQDGGSKTTNLEDEQIQKFLRDNDLI